MLNDPKLTKRLMGLFDDVVGAENIKPRLPVMGGEDFGRFAQSGAPTCMYFLGTIAPDRFAESRSANGKPLPSTHNDGYAPLPEPSIKFGVKTMTLAVMDLMGPKK
jgi:hippurate hydrolase